MQKLILLTVFFISLNTFAQDVENLGSILGLKEFKMENPLRWLQSKFISHRQYLGM